MRKLVWVLGWSGAAFWSLVCAVGAIGLNVVGATARFFGGEVPGFPVETGSLPWFAALVERFGGSALLIGWLTGVGVILFVTLLVTRLLPRRPDPLPVDPRTLRVPGFNPSSGPYGRALGPSELTKKVLDRFRRR